MPDRFLWSQGSNLSVQTALPKEQTPNPGDRGCLIFDPQTAGHHREYLRYLYTALRERSSGNLNIHFHVNPAIIESEGLVSRTNLFVHALDPALCGDGERLPDEALALRQVEFISQKASKGLHAFFPRINAYLDALEAGSFPRDGMTSSGILFAPAMAAWSYRGGALRARLGAAREVLRLRRLRSTAGLKRLYVLNDHRSSGILDRFTSLPDGIRPLADPVAAGPRMFSRGASPGTATEQPRTFTFLLAGSLRPGKGIVETLNAFRTWKPLITARVRLILAGSVNNAFADTCQQAVKSFRTTTTRVELQTDTGFLSGAALDQHIRDADYLLVPYVRPLGSSGILGHAARTGTPVLGTEAGLIGHLIRSYTLGRTFNIHSERAWHAGLNAAVEKTVQMENDGRLRYLRDNAIDRFQGTIVGYFAGEKADG